MSVDYSFAKKVTLSDLKKLDNTKLTYYHESQLWVLERGEEEWVQITLQNPSGDFEKDCDECIYEFTGRGYGSELIRDISVMMNSQFLTDNEEDYMIRQLNGETPLTEEEADKLYDELWLKVASNYGLTENDGLIKKTPTN